MKTWVRRGDCVPVFSKRMKKELFTLHPDNCWENVNFCSYITANIIVTKKLFLDQDGFMPAKRYQAGWVNLLFSSEESNGGKMDWYQDSDGSTKTY